MSAFVDECGLNVRGGDGGAGCVAFRHEGPVVMGGPNGGDGGKGGDVWLVADRNVASLLAFRDHPHRRGKDGIGGKGKDMHGRSGEDLIVHVPEGTVAKDLYTGEVLADLVSHGDRWLAAEGGRGGRGNAKFLSNKRREPRFAEQGEFGVERWMTLELKLMADVALVGFPNAGKSTFISSISAARPKIAAYPFTTLEPHLGVVRISNDADMVVADIPGLIEGAADGKGLGHQFLRHIERARVLCVLVDLAPVDGMEPAEQERVLLKELGAYDPGLLERPRLVVGSKVDVAALTYDGLCMSAVTHDGLQPVIRALYSLVEEARKAEPVNDSFVVLRPEPEGVWIDKMGDGEFRVNGRSAERIVAISDITSADALAYIDHRMEKLGVGKALSKAGARAGDVIWIGGFSFEYEP
jgi:GTPase